MQALRDSSLKGGITGWVSVTVRSPRHWILSPPRSVVEACLERTALKLEKTGGTDEDWGRIFIEKFRYEVYKAIELSDIDGAAVVIHLYRIKKDKQREIRKAMNRLNLQGGSWDYVRAQPDWQKYLYFYPHVHLVGYGTNIPGFYKKSKGWLLKLRPEIEPGPDGKFNTAGLFYYLLGHAPVVAGKVSVTYVGCMSSRRLACIKKVTERLEVLCPECGANMCYCSVDENMEITAVHADRPLYRKVEHYTYEIRDPDAPPPPIPRRSRPLRPYRRSDDID